MDRFNFIIFLSIVIFTIAIVVFFWAIKINDVTISIQKSCNETCYPYIVKKCNDMAAKCATADGGVVLKENKQENK